MLDLLYLILAISVFSQEWMQCQQFLLLNIRSKEARASREIDHTSGFVSSFFMVSVNWKGTMKGEDENKLTSLCNCHLIHFQTRSSPRPDTPILRGRPVTSLNSAEVLGRWARLSGGFAGVSLMIVITFSP